jgi:hypothetical protein
MQSALGKKASVETRTVGIMGGHQHRPSPKVPLATLTEPTASPVRQQRE